MPNIYKRKDNAPPRGLWSENDLQKAMNAVKEGNMGVNEAAKHFLIPKTTLKRRLKSNNSQKSNRLGPDSALGVNAEAKLANHIKKLQKNGFCPTREEVREMAYHLAEEMGTVNKFSASKGKAGQKWLELFLRRRPDIVVRKSENVSIARAMGMSKPVVQLYFENLERVLTENLLFDKPGNIFNCDETGLQLNTRPGQVLAQKGSKCVSSISPGEKGETISVLACINAEGGYLPPYCIMKGKNKKEEWNDGLPPGSRIKMSEKSAYVNSEIFLDWLKNHFLPKKPNGTVLLVLDGHSSHTSNLETLQFAEEHNIILFCLPPHTTHVLQPLDRCFFKSLKGQYYEACRYFVKNHKDRKLSRLNFGKLLGESWGKSATVQNALSSFRSTGIMPFNPNIIPEHAFFVKDLESDGPPATNLETIEMPNLENIARPLSPKPGPSGLQNLQEKTPPKNVTTSDLTPGQILDKVSPVPEITLAVRKVRRQLTGVLSSENCKKKSIQAKGKGKQSAQAKGKQSAQAKINQSKIKQVKKKTKYTVSSSDSDEEPKLDDSEEAENLDDYENECVGCGEDYRKTKKNEEWIKCVICQRWLHENCSNFEAICQGCGLNVTKKKS